MQVLRRPAAVLVAIALAGGLAACGDDDDEASTTASTTATTAAATGADAVDVEMKEFSYTVGGNLKSGGTIRLSNTGKEFHMVGFQPLGPGQTIADLTALLSGEEPPAEEPSTTVAAGGATTTTTEAEEEDGEGEEEAPFGPTGAIVGPGQAADITIPDLGEGNYAMICYLPVEGDAEGTEHFKKGMIAQLTVVGAQAAEPTADATYKLEPGKPITGPATLSAGKHVIKLETVGDAGQLEPAIAKLNPGSTIEDVNRVFATFDADDFLFPVNAAALVPAQVVAAMFDLGPSTEVYVGVDLTSGTYAIDAHDADPDDAPLDPVEKITITVT